MEEGDSANGNQPPLSHMFEWIRHSLFLQE